MNFNNFLGYTIAITFVAWTIFIIYALIENAGIIAEELWLLIGAIEGTLASAFMLVVQFYFRKKSGGD